MPVKKLTVGTTEVTLVEGDEARSALAIANDHDTQVLYISDLEGKGTDGFPIFPKSYIALSKPEGYEIDKKWYVIASGASTPCHILEMFLKKPDPIPVIVTVKYPSIPDLQNPQEQPVIDPKM